MKVATKCPIRPRFAVGDRVRVRQGTIDPDYPMLPLSGWAGTVLEVAETGPAPYRIRWSRATLAKVHPVYRQLCAEGDRCFEEMWLDDADLVRDAGGPLLIQSPDRHRGAVRLLGRSLAPRGRGPRPAALATSSVTTR